MTTDLPKPTGPYPVSFTDVLDKPGKDGTFFRIYYPSKEYDTSKVTFPQWMEQEYFKQISVYMKGITLFPLSVPLNLPLRIPKSTDKLPIVIFSHGLMLSKDPYSFICSDLASYGYLVAAVDHKDGSAAGSFYMEKEVDSETLVRKSLEHQFIPFGTAEAEIKRREQVEIRVRELSKVLDLLQDLNEGKLSNIYDQNSNLSQFKGNLLFKKTAVMGHSQGGSSALVALAKDDRIKVAVAHDPWMLAVDDKYLKIKVDKPIIFINCIGDIKKKDVIKMRQMDSDVTGVTAERLMVTLLGTTHFTQTDFCFFSESFLKSLNFVAENDAKLSNTINTELSLSFLAKYFGIQGSEDLDSIMTQYQKYAVIGTDIDVTDAEILDAKKLVMSTSQS